tara:strand:- start:130 stop:327 length:198 start_codon:yes stop_codon:yes gene_type:complete
MATAVQTFIQFIVDPVSTTSNSHAPDVLRVVTRIMVEHRGYKVENLTFLEEMMFLTEHIVIREKL